MKQVVIREAEVESGFDLYFEDLTEPDNDFLEQVDLLDEGVMETIANFLR